MRSIAAAAGGAGARHGGGRPVTRAAAARGSGPGLRAEAEIAHSSMAQTQCLYSGRWTSLRRVQPPGADFLQGGGTRGELRPRRSFVLECVGGWLLSVRITRLSGGVFGDLSCPSPPTSTTHNKKGVRIPHTTGRSIRNGFIAQIRNCETARDMRETA
eukprot:3622116-Prymnesium_polylepis.1